MSKQFESALWAVGMIVALWAAIHIFEVDIRDPKEVYHFGATPAAATGSAFDPPGIQ